MSKVNPLSSLVQSAHHHDNDDNHNATRSSPPKRSSSSMCKELITKLRPLPFQYVWSMWHSRPDEEYALKQLADNIADIGAFYRIYNNFPWDRIRVKDSIHFFRIGVRPLWEDRQNVHGGSWTIKVKREDGKALRVWEELCLLTCGGELQAELTSERDHILGISYSPRLYAANISIWTQKGQNQKSIHLLESTVLARLSPDLRPISKTDYYYKQHDEHATFQIAAPKEANLVCP